MSAPAPNVSPADAVPGRSYAPQQSPLPTWKRVYRWYNGRKQTKAANAYASLCDMYAALGRHGR